MSVYQKIKALKYKKTIEKIVDYAIINLDKDGRIDEWSTSAKKIFGYSSNDVKGKHFLFLFSETGKQSLKAGKILIQAVKFGKTTGKHSLKRKDHSYFNANILGNLIADSQRGIIGFSLIVTDLSTKKKIEEGVKEYKQRKVEKDELSKGGEQESSALQLEELIKGLNIVSNSLSHDMRAPLRALDGYMKILEEDYSPLMDSDGKRYLSLMKKNSIKMNRLIENLVAFSRISTRQLKKTKVDIDEVVNDSVKELNKIQPNKAKIIVGSLPSIQADYALISLAFIHLISNAIKFSSKCLHPVVSISGEIGEREVVYTIEDNGVGFDMQYSEKLFETFQRLHVEEEFDGSGIGLSIVKLIASKHNGIVSVEAEENKGAKFYFKLPLT